MKNYRAYLVKTIIKSFVEGHLFDHVSNIKQELQNILNSNLKFETKVSDFEIKNDCVFSHVSFEDEIGDTRVVDVVITKTVKLIESYE